MQSCRIDINDCFIKKFGNLKQKEKGTNVK